MRKIGFLQMPKSNFLNFSLSMTASLCLFSPKAIANEAQKASPPNSSLVAQYDTIFSENAKVYGIYAGYSSNLPLLPSGTGLGSDWRIAAVVNQKVALGYSLHSTRLSHISSKTLGPINALAQDQGAFLEYTPHVGDLFHLATSVYLGSGHLQLIQTQPENNPFQRHLGQQHYSLARASVIGFTNLTNWLRLGISLGYSHSSEIKTYDFSKKILSTPELGFVIKAGKYF